VETGGVRNTSSFIEVVDNNQFSIFIFLKYKRKPYEAYKAVELSAELVSGDVRSGEVNS